MSRHHRLEAGEPGQGAHLPQAVQLDHRGDPLGERRVAPQQLGKPAGVKVGIDRHVVAVPLLRRENSLQLHLLHRPFLAASGPDLPDGLQDFLIVESRKGLGDLLLPLHDRELSGLLDDRQVVPMVPHHLLDIASPVGKGRAR